MSMNVLVWTIDWAALELALQNASPDAVDPTDYEVRWNPQIYVPPEGKEYEMPESRSIIGDMRDSFKQIARKCSPELANILQQVFITPFSGAVDDLGIGDNQSENWEWVWSSLSPTSVERLYQLSLEIDPKDLILHFRPTESWGFHFGEFWEFALAWKQTLAEANHMKHGLLITTA